MNLVTMRTRLRRRIGNPDAIDVINSVLDEHINTAYRQLVNDYRFHLGRKICTFNTIDNVTRYGIPTDCVVIIRMRNNTSEIRLEKFDARRRYEITGFTSDEKQKGPPQDYVRFRDWVELMPVPDGVYEIEMYYKFEVLDLVADEDVPVIPLSWHEGIIKLAKYCYYADEQGDIPKSIQAQNDFDIWVQRQPVEFDEEKIDFDSGVIIPALQRPSRGMDPIDE